eukprot:TRINITY_DN5584_c0_g1_i5.p1 TRINITY_DN5584_c0_g1~~TRINITY_DN5584_c0_g1_i5.p1  ORF type:complete len:205 (-),score=28.15 TRINITY_DN5584_c0_g1_i5:174-788(-)
MCIRDRYKLPKFWVNLSKKNLFNRREVFSRPSLQICLGLILGLLCTMTALVVYEISSGLFPDDYANMRLPVRSNYLYLGAMTIEFVFINPILEQIYWNVFLVGLCEPGKKITLRTVAKITTFFGLYHFFTISYIIGIRLAIPATIGISFAGLCFLFIRCHFGLLASILTHLGADLGIVLVIFDLVFNNILQTNSMHVKPLLLAN